MQIHVARGEQQLGVFFPEDVRNKLAAGQLLPSDYGWSDGMAQWTPLSVFPGLLAGAPLPPMAAAPVYTGGGSAYAGGGYVQAAPTSGLAITSLVFGILSLTFLPIIASLPAVICGHMARSQINKSGGTIGGGGVALGGLITGYIGMFFAAIFVLAIGAGIALPAFAVARERAQEAASMNNGRQIAIACRAYAADHNGSFPPTLNELVPKYLPNAKTLTCPLTGPSQPIGYEYYGGKDSDPGSRILLVSKGASRVHNKGTRRVVVHVDGSAELDPNMPVLPPGGK
jgi:hypothetical protein